MQIRPIKTHKITSNDKDILSVIDKYVEKLEENSILVVTSKIVSICEGSTVPIGTVDKGELVIGQADKYLPKETNSFGLLITIKNNILAVNAGIDESNSSGQYVLWPKNSQESANKIREHLVSKFKLKNVGVIISDSKTTPLRWGVTGVAIAHSGFSALNNLIGTPDIFGRLLKVTTVNVMDGIAVAAVVVMGEGSEQTPLSIVTDIPFVNFQDHNPTGEELKLIDIEPETDMYGTILQSTPWIKGKSK